MEADPKPKNTEEEFEGPVIELGDRIRIFGGKYDKTIGRVIYRTNNELHLIPDGMTNMIIEFNLDEDGFDPETEVESVEILSKRKKNALVDILDLNVDQNLETFDINGNPVITYQIVKVIPEEDTIIVKTEDSDEEIPFHFGFRGVPKDLPFRVIRGRQPPEKPIMPPLDKVTEVTEEAKESEDGEEGEEEEQEDFTYLDDDLEAAPAEFSEGVEQLTDIPTSERTYSNQTQKSEAYADFLSLNSPALQKQPDTQRKVRVLTEIFFQLRASILRLSEDGTPKGVKSSSIQTLADILETRLVNISRPIVDIDKILFYDKNPDDESEEKGLSSDSGILLEDFTHNILSSNDYLEKSIDMNGQKFPSFLNSYLNRYSATWRSGPTHKVAFLRDEEAFRRSVPEQSEGENTLFGYNKYLPAAKDAYLSSDLISNNLSISLTRALKTVRTRSHIVQIGDEAPVTGYVMFPLNYADSLTQSRKESLAADIEAGLRKEYTMKEILQNTGDISDVPSVNNTFLVSVDGGTLGNISLREYIKAITLRAEGMGDVWNLQGLLGMRDREWTIDQQEIFKESIKTTHGQILDEIIRQRESLAQMVSQPPAVQGILMVPDGTQMIEKLGDEPNLKELQNQIKEQMPGYSGSDVALVALLLRHHGEYCIAQLADQPAALTKARMVHVRNKHNLTLENLQKVRLRKNFAGREPVPIHCAHVKSLQMIRKIADQNTRMALLAKFLTMFQGVKKDNWVRCNVGDHNLLCVHELLQVYQYLRPGDVNALNKDIQLNFGGGQFQGYYICRNCGQPIQEIEYDTHIEFDDKGRPMMGRAEIVDKDAIQQEEIEELIGPMGDIEDAPKFDNETKKLIYSTTKELANRLFAPLEPNDYLKIVSRVYGLIQQIPSREVYIKAKKSMKSKTAVVDSDYDIYINQALVCSVGVQTLLAIQTHVPELILRGTPSGCRNLGGQPLEPESGTQGIDCVISVISSFQKDAAPWNLTQFQQERDDTRRQKLIKGIFEPILRAALQDPTILQGLSQKRDYRRKTLGAAGGQGRPDETIPENFAPIPFDMKPEDFVEKVIVEDAASLQDRAELWIRQGNFLAKKYKLPMPLVFSETSCCLSPLEHIDDFWNRPENKQSLPRFDKRSGIPAPPKITRTEPTMIPSQIVRPLPDAPESSYYQLFLKVCYDGEKKGHSHEFGLTHICIWCNLHLPNEVELLTPLQGLNAIEEQGIEVTKETFEDLLNETHRVNSFETRLLTQIPGPLDNWISLMAMDPEPAEGYKEAMAKTQSEIAKLPVDAKEVEVALALTDFSSLAGSLESKFKTRMPKSQYSIFDEIIEGGAGSVIRFLQSYCIVPLQQFITNQSPDLQIPKRWQLSFQHQSDVMNILANHRGYLAKFNKTITTPWLKSKIETFLAQARVIIDKLQTIRPLQIPGGSQTYGFFLKLCLFAPLGNFVDPNTLPITQEEAPDTQVEQQALFPAKFISDMTNRFKQEGFNLTPEQIRQLIAERNEIEKANIISKMNGMSRAGVDIEKIKIKLGIGEYAVGGTKAIYAYDKERYDIEREQRAQAGIIDFPGVGPDGPNPGEGGQQREVDGLGYFQTQGDEEGYLGQDDLMEATGFDED